MDVTKRRDLFALLAGATVGGWAQSASAQAAPKIGPPPVTTVPATDSDNLIMPATPDVLPLSVRGSLGQRRNLTEWRSSDDRVLAAITSRGAMHRTPPEGGARAPFTWEVSAVPFNGVMNPTAYFGYNAGYGGTQVVADEASATYTIESDYFDGDKHTIEMYSEITTERGAVRLRPFFWQIVRNATDPQRAIARASIMGDPLVIESPAGDMLATFERDRVVVHSTNPETDTSVSIRAGEGRVGYLGLGADEATDVLIVYPTNARGDRAHIDLAGATILHLFSTPLGVSGASISVGEADNQAAGVFAVGSSNIDVKALVARGRASQRADLQQWQDHTGAPLAGVTPLGRLRWSATNEADSAGAGGAGILPERPAKYLVVVDSNDQPLLVPAYKPGTEGRQ